MIAWELQQTETVARVRFGVNNMFQSFSIIFNQRFPWNIVPSKATKSPKNMTLSENVGYIPNEIAIFHDGIMISKTIGYNGVLTTFSDTYTTSSQALRLCPWEGGAAARNGSVFPSPPRWSPAPGAVPWVQQPWWMVQCTPRINKGRWRQFNKERKWWTDGYGCVWKCCVPHCTQWFCWSLSLLNGYNWGHTLFSDKPIWAHPMLPS